jgi:DNA-directed RNA polymerase subunit omega
MASSHINNLVQDALKKVENPQILINVISKRVRQLGLGYRPLVYAKPRASLMEVALQEVAEGKLTFEPLDPEPATQ